MAARNPSRVLTLSRHVASQSIGASFLRPLHRQPGLLLPKRLYNSTLQYKPPRTGRTRLRRVITISAFSVFFTSVGFLIATAPAIASVTALMSAPTDAESLRLFKAPDEVAANIDHVLNEHPIAKALRADPRWHESRPHLRYPEEFRKHSLTAGTLLGPGRVPVPPVVFTDDKHLVSFSYLGTDMCGHVGVVHGGFLATMMDEALARCAFISLPHHIGVTANLTLNYRKPTPAGSFVVLKAETTHVDGRKVRVKGRLELLGEDDEPGALLVEAEGLFVEPKYAKVSVDPIHAVDLVKPVAQIHQMLPQIFEVPAN